MGVLNVTPDSFSDGGEFVTTAAAVEHAGQMIAAGAVIIDIGGESTRPGAAAVPLAAELERVVPVVTALHCDTSAIISIDTSKPEVMQAAIAAGAHLVNDVNGLREPGALEVCAGSAVGVCLMHMQGTPRTMQSEPVYNDVVSEVFDFLAARIEACEAAGIDRDRIVVDPGFGFGKTVEHNLQLLAALECFLALRVPLLVGLSRKSLLGALTGRKVDQRLAGSVALATLATARGASIIRAHDVAETVDAVTVAAAIRAF
ncbi:MAG: dihydropteroate synthase [Gammaproteobacteria bacterium]|nr:dihydropteroate synthase [Gammaproteobacteria bacterium]